ncbi:MAG: MarR family transcriptional regulator [Coriobacteriia bacterium]|nr:MarR family transcriptional regulator [Coriobacteriia bacterium]MBN2822401.1 MarR family transcriptional regulator [Coriobacteriia bacterium]
MHHMPHDAGFAAPEGVGLDAFGVFMEFKNTMLLQRRFMQKLLADEETHPAQAACLHILAHKDGLSQSELAEKLHVSRPTATTMLQKMEASGVIERRPDQQDQRLIRIYLTQSGKSLVTRLEAVFAQLIRAGVGSMTEKDRTELRRLLDILNQNLTLAIDEA